MNRKILVVAFILMTLPVCTIMFAHASPVGDKNNDKFESFAVTGQFPFSEILLADHQYQPSKDNVELLLITYDEQFTSMEITIGSNTYKLGTDFAYSGHAKYVFHEVTAWLTIPNRIPPLLWPTAYRSSMLTVDYTYDFSAISGGINGVLNVRAVDGHVSSLSGTGDLQNVQIKAVVGDATTVNGVVTIEHEGIVLGWPNIQPAA